MEGDKEIFEEIKDIPEISEKVTKLREEIKITHGRHADTVISSERHALSMNIFEDVAKVVEPLKSFRERVDDLLTNKYLGYPLLFLILFGIFLYSF